MRQDIHSPTGIESQCGWTLIATVRDGAVVMLEFFLDVPCASLGRADLSEVSPVRPRERLLRGLPAV